MNKIKSNKKSWTVELNIGSRILMPYYKDNKAIDIEQILDELFNNYISTYDVGAIFRFEGKYNNETEMSFYVNFKYRMAQNELVSLYKIIENLCIELGQECIAYNIIEWPKGYGKQDLIYHPEHEGDELVFSPVYFKTFGKVNLSDVSNTK